MNAATEQRLKALEHANEIRGSRARLKRDIAAGRVGFAALLVDPPEWLLSARVFDIALSIPRAGRVKVLAAFRIAACSVAKTFGNVTPDQRRRLLEALRSWPSLRERIGESA